MWSSKIIIWAFVHFPFCEICLLWGKKQKVFPFKQLYQSDSSKQCPIHNKPNQQVLVKNILSLRLKSTQVVDRKTHTFSICLKSKANLHRNHGDDRAKSKIDSVNGNMYIDQSPYIKHNRGQQLKPSIGTYSCCSWAQNLYTLKWWCLRKFILRQFISVHGTNLIELRMDNVPREDYVIHIREGPGNVWLELCAGLLTPCYYSTCLLTSHFLKCTLLAKVSADLNARPLMS